MAHANGMGHWVPQTKMLEFIDRLMHVRHPDYDTIREIRDRIEEFQDEDQLLSVLADECGFDFEDRAQVVSELKDRQAIWELVDEQEDGAFGDDEAPLVERVKAGLADAKTRVDAYLDIRALCVDAGLIAPGDRDTDVLPLLRMFLPVSGS